MNSKQCRAARSLLDWSQDELAKRVNCAKKTITDFEKGNRSPQSRTIRDIIKIFEDFGIEFDGNEKMCSVKLNYK